MIIDGTSDKIQFKLGDNVSTNQLVFTVDYINYTLTTSTLNTNNGISNNTTAVDLIPSPGSLEQNELRYCSIYNSDTVAKTVLILVYNGTTTYQIFQAVLSPNCIMQYQLEKGWEVLDSLGNKKNYSIHSFGNKLRSANKNYRATANGAYALATQSLAYTYLGRADKAYSSITVRYTLAGAGVSMTIAEMGIYSNKFMGTDYGPVLGNRVGYIDASNIWNSLGTKTTVIPVTGVSVGDVLRIGFYCSAGTYPQLRALNTTNEFFDQGLYGAYLGTSLSSRLSGTNSFLYNSQGLPTILIRWQGN